MRSIPVREVFLGVRATRKLGLPQPWKAAEPNGVRHTLFSFGSAGREGGNPLGRAHFRASVRLLPKLYAIAEVMCLLEMGRHLASDAVVKT